MKIRTDGTLITQFEPGDDNLADLAFDGVDVWAVNTFGTLQRFTVAGDPVDTIGGLIPEGAWGLTYDPAGYMWVSNQLTDSLYMISAPQAVTEDPWIDAPETTLLQSQPNPFVSRTQISFSLGNEGPVILRIYDSRGALIRTLDYGHRSAGVHSATWDGANDAGVRLSKGVYFIRLETLDGVRTSPVLMISY
jgi:hypothetical protein